MSELLFQSYSPQNVVRFQMNTITDVVDSMGAREVLDTSFEDMVEYLTDRWRIDPVTVNESGISVHPEEIPVDVARNPRYDLSFVVDGRYVPGTRVSYFVPFTGDVKLLRCQPSHSSLRPLRAAVESGEIEFTYDRVEGQQAEIGDAFQQDLKQLLNHAGRVNAEVANFNATLPEFVKQQLASRRQKLLRDRNFRESIGYPIRVSPDSPLTSLVQDVRRRVIPQKPRASKEPFKPEWALDMDDYEHILFVASRMAIFMERSPRTFRGMDEESVRDLFLAILNTHYEGQVTGETFNYEGKTDILIRAEDRNIFIAECKFWSGPKGLTKAVDQLLGYTAWRDTKTAVLLFNRNRKMSTVVEKVPKTARDHPSYKREERRSSETEFRYVFGHREDASRELTLTVLVFDVPA